VSGSEPGSPVAIPTIETERLRLRGHRPDDFPDCLAMWTEPDVTRYIGGKPSTEQQAWTRMLTYIGHWSFMGFGYWAVEDKATGRYMGDVGFADFHRDVAASMRGVPELGWALATAYHGRGYGTEAVAAAAAWGDANFETARTVCLVDCENVPSLRVAQRCGYHEFERAPFSGRPTVFMERIAP
jgi:RimJ/RimL family protein N-acetyltransferase